jgi:hypothetical protein
MDVGTRKVICKRLFIKCEFTEAIALWKDIPQYRLQDHTRPKELLIQARWLVVLCDHETDGRRHHRGHFGEQYILSQRHDQEQALLCNKNLLGTPSLNNAREKCLFRIVCNISCKTVDDTPEMVVRTSCDFWLGHSWF